MRTQKAEAQGEALRASELSYRRLFESARDGILILEADTGRVTDVNPFLVEMLGFSHDEMVGKTVGELSPFKDAVANLAMLERLQKEGYVRYEDLPLETRDGRHIAVEFVSNVYQAGETKVIQCNIRDITERQRVEAALGASETRFRTIFNQSPLGIAEGVIADARFVTLNQRYADILGYSIEELRGLTFKDYIYPEDLTKDLAEFEKLAAGELRSFATEKRYIRKDGVVIWVNLSVAALSPPGEKPKNCMAVIDDVTERKQAEEKLHRSEEILRLFVEHSPAAIAMFDSEMKYLMVSRRYMTDYHLGEQRLLGRSHYEVFPEIPERWKEIHRRCLAGAGEKAEEDLFSRADGSHDWVRWEIQPWHHADGAVGGIILFSNVITERKRSKEALEQIRERLVLATSSAHIGIWDWDVTANELIWDAQMYELYGIREQDFNGAYDAWKKGLHPDDLKRGDAAIAAAIAGVKDFDIEFRVVWPNGEVHHIEAHAVVQRADNGSATRMIGVNWDITERKLAEESHARLAMAVEQSSEDIVITDTAANIVYVNPAFEKTTGYTRAEVLGKNPRILTSGKHDAEFYRQMWDVLRRGEVWQGHIINKRKDGKLYEEEATISPVRDASGKIVNYVAVKRDVTREVQLEAQFRHAQKMESIGQLAGGIAHDFNNILTVIMMQSQLTGMDENISPETREGLLGINSAAERAANLTRQLLLFSRKQVMQPSQLDLNEVVTSLAKMLQRVVREDVDLVLHLKSTPLMTFADAGMVDQVLMNLAVNARDAMPKGGKLVIETNEKIIDAGQAAQNPEASPGRFVWLSVSDTGCGMTPEIQSRIFEPFFTTKEVGQGTGLGLATVFGIVKQHKGWLKVYSEVGQGTTFQVFLPASDVSAEVLAREAAKPKPRGGTETILVAEDDPAVRMLTRTVLERNGYNVLEAADGVGAQRLWTEHQDRIALLLTDLVMPGGVDGHELAANLQSQRPALKVIFTSGYSADIAGQTLKLQAGQNFVQKPCPPDQLLEAVRNALDG